MAEGARLANEYDFLEFNNLFTSGRREIEDRKGSELWVKLESLGNSASEIFKEYLSNERKALIVGEYCDYPLGFMLVEIVNINQEKAANIQEVFVDMEARDVGLGEVIMDHAIEWSRSKGASVLLGRAFPGDRATKNYFERFHITARLIEVSKKI